MATLQPLQELEAWHRAPDPWQYESHPDDARRREILLSELPRIDYARVLDIGCGQGFVTRSLPGRSVLGIDISAEAVARAATSGDERVKYLQCGLLDAWRRIEGRFDLVVITGVLYPQYIGNALQVVYRVVDRLLADGGVLASVHIDAWYRARFPYLMLREHRYAYREYVHRLEIYAK
jgi:predicted TPR repeat methyltransferase